MTALDDAWAEWQSSRLLKTWALANPGEWQRVKAYRAGGSRPDCATPVGRALVYETDAWRAATPPPAPTPRSVFAGIGVWTAQTAERALDLPASVEWVAIRPDLTPEEVADELRARFRLHVWEANVYTGQLAVDDFHAAGYIGQAEGPGQLAAVQALGPMSVPKAIVGNGPWLPDWTPLLECYQVSVPSDLGPGFPVLGVFDGFPLANYLPSLGARRDFSVYLAEGMTDADRELLGAL